MAMCLPASLQLVGRYREQARSHRLGPVPPTHLFVMLKEDKHTHAWADCINVACAENKQTNAFRSGGFSVVTSAPAKTFKLFSDRRNR
jgi:hypothetical protein